MLCGGLSSLGLYEYEWVGVGEDLCRGHVGSCTVAKTILQQTRHAAMLAGQFFRTAAPPNTFLTAKTLTDQKSGENTAHLHHFHHHYLRLKHDLHPLEEVRLVARTERSGALGRGEGLVEGGGGEGTGDEADKWCWWGVGAQEKWGWGGGVLTWWW